MKKCRQIQTEDVKIIAVKLYRCECVCVRALVCVYNKTFITL